MNKEVTLEEINGKLKRLSEKDWNGFYIPKHSAKLILDSLKKGNSVLIPDGNSFIPGRIINGNTGYPLPAKDLIPALITKEDRGFKSEFVVTKTTVNKSGTQITAGEKGLWYNFQDKENNYHHAAYYFPEQTQNPEKVIGNVKKPVFTKEVPGKIEVHKAEEYMPAFIEASKTGSLLVASEEVKASFKNLIENICDNELKRTKAEKDINIPGLNDFLYKSEMQAYDNIRQNNKKIEQEHTQTQTKQNSQKISISR